MCPRFFFFVKEYKGQHDTTLVLNILPFNLDPCLLQNYAEVYQDSKSCWYWDTDADVSGQLNKSSFRIA